MKSLITVLSLVFSASAFANSFDGFVGNYNTVGEPTVQVQNASFCNRFSFKSITGLEIKADTIGYKQSHVLYIVNPFGWAVHPISDYVDSNIFNPAIGISAKTTGSDDFASNDWSSFGLAENGKLVVTIKKHGTNFMFTMAEEFATKEAVTSACYYQVEMEKQP